MTSDEIVKAVIQGLNRLDIPYMMVGSLSTNVYGIPRATRDADFVVQVSDVQVTALVQGLGPTFQLDPQISFETITGTTRYVIRLPGDEFRVELFLLSDDPHDQTRFARRIARELEGSKVYLPTVEDVVITKLRWSQRGRRLKDMDDVRKVVDLQNHRIDWPYVESWCDRHGTRGLLEEIRASVLKDP